MSDVLDKVRAKYPQYKDVPDDDLAFQLGTKYPSYLDQDEKFRTEFQAASERRQIQAPPASASLQQISYGGEQRPPLGLESQPQGNLITDSVVPTKLFPQPKTALEGGYNTLVKTLGAATSPLAAAVGPLAGGEAVIGKTLAPYVTPAVRGLFAGLGAKGAGEAAGTLAGSQDLSVGQKVELAGDTAANLLMTAGAVPEFVKPVTKGAPNAIPERSPAAVPVEEPPRSGTEVGARVPGTETPATPQAPAGETPVQAQVKPTLAEDQATFKDLVGKQNELISKFPKGGTDKEVAAWEQAQRELQTQVETVKNRHGGNPPPMPSEKPLSPKDEQSRISQIETEIMRRGKPGEILAIQHEATQRGLTDTQYLDLLEKWWTKQQATESGRTKIPESGSDQYISVGPGAASPAEFASRENRRRLLSDVVEHIFGTRAGEATDALLRKAAGEAVPKTMALSGESGNKMVEFASATTAAPHMARSLTREVLGDNFKDAKFRERLGAVLVEDRLRAIREGLTKAGKADEAAKVQTLVGPGKVFKTEAEFQGALKDPDISGAIDRHKQTVQYEAQRFHTEAGGQLAGPGLNTGAFVNLLPLYEDAPGAVFAGATKGDYTRPFKKKSVFSRQAKGTADKYELDYGTLAERMVRGNYEEFTKRQLYDQLVKDGLAVIKAPGEPRPTFDGKPGVKFQIKRQVMVQDGVAIPQYENLWVRPDVASELRQAENLNGPISNVALAKIAGAINRIQLAGPTDAVWHIANMFSSIAGSQGGKTLLADLARKMPLANVIDTAVRLTQAAKKVIAQDPATLEQLAELAKSGAVRPERAGGGINSRVINLLDKAGRIVRDDMYKNLVQRGMITASEAGRREWVNQMGNYNPRLMGQIESFFKEAGLSPFIVAGRNFNRMALRKMLLSPGVRAADVQAAIQMRVIEAAGITATLLTVPALINFLTVGKPMGRPGVPFGAIDTGKDANGKHVYIDPAQWIGLRRGMRLTGVNAAVEGMRRGESVRDITKQAGRDIISAAVHPWSGPPVQMGLVGASGYSTGFRKESADPGNHWENFKAALKQLNPLLHGFFQRQDKSVGGTVAATGTTLAGAAGLKFATPVKAQQQIQNLAQRWMEASNNPRLRQKFEEQGKQQFGPSIYAPLRTALHASDLDKAREEYDKLLAERDVNGKRVYTASHILSEMRPWTTDPLTYSRRWKPVVHSLNAAENRLFLKSLTPEQQQLYTEAQHEREQAFETFRRMLRKK